MMDVTDRYRAWLGTFRDEPSDILSIAQSALDAFDSCEGKDHLSPSDIEPLVRAASDSHTLAFETGCNLLVLLARTNKEAQHSLVEIAQSKKSTARFNVIAFLDEELPVALRLDILATALRDRSAKVRVKAVEQTERFEFVSLLPMLLEIQCKEDGKVLRALAWHIPLLRDGHHIKTLEDGTGYYLTVRNRETGSICCDFIPARCYTPDHVKEEIARLLAGE